MPTTTEFEWTTPVVGGDPGTWGNILNAAFEEIDGDLDAVKTTADAALPATGGVMTGEIEILAARYGVSALGSISGATALNLNTANVFTCTLSSATTFSFTGWTNGKAEFVAVQITNGGTKATWPAAVKWDGGTTPSLRTTGVDIVTFMSLDNGTTIRGVHAYSSAT